MQLLEPINTEPIKNKASNKYLKTWTQYKYARKPRGPWSEPVSRQRWVTAECAWGHTPLARAGVVPELCSCTAGSQGPADWVQGGCHWNPHSPKSILPPHIRTAMPTALLPSLPHCSPQHPGSLRQGGQRAPSHFNCLRSYLWYATKYLVVLRTACHRQLCC